MVLNDCREAYYMRGHDRAGVLHLIRMHVILSSDGEVKIGLGSQGLERTTEQFANEEFLFDRSFDDNKIFDAER